MLQNYHKSQILSITTDVPKFCFFFQLEKGMSKFSDSPSIIRTSRTQISVATFRNQQKDLTCMSQIFVKLSIRINNVVYSHIHMQKY